MGELLHCIFGGIPRSFLIMFPTARVAAVDVEEPGWENIGKDGIHCNLELVVKEV